MSFSTILSTTELAELLGRPSLVVVDVRSSLADADYGRNAYAAGHIPGAVYADLNRDLSDPPGGGRGRHPLPDVETIATTLGRLGISSASHVVAYDDADGMYASRLWWMLKFLGHERVAVLDGGVAKWISEQRAVSTDAPAPTPVEFVASPRHEMLASAADVGAMRGDPSRLLLDSRAPDRFRGENETIDPVGGHIPGARNRFFKLNVREDGTMRPASELAVDFRHVLGAVTPEATVAYCGSGVTACQNLLAMAHAGLTGAKLFAGSWREWVSEPDRPIATGEED